MPTPLAPTPTTAPAALPPAGGPATVPGGRRSGGEGRGQGQSRGEGQNEEQHEVRGEAGRALRPLDDGLRARLLRPLEEGFGTAKLSLWLDGGRGLTLCPHDGVLTLRLPHRFAADRLAQSGLAAALDASAAAAGLPEAGAGVGAGAGKAAAAEPYRRLRLVVGPAAPGRRSGPGPGCGGALANAAPAGPGGASAAGVAAPATHRVSAPPRQPQPGRGATRGRRAPGPALADFVVGPCNELAHAAACGLAEGDRRGPGGSVLFLHGGCGMGKTHLLGGIVRAWRERSGGAGAGGATGAGGGVGRAARSGRVVHVTGEAFTNRFIDHARRGALSAFRAEVRGASLLAVDDVHFIAGKLKTRDELLHCFDAASAAGVPVVFASDRHPRELDAMGSALSSRCLQGLVAEVLPPDAEMKRRLLRELGTRRGLRISAEVAARLEPLAGGSAREIEGLLAKLDVLARLAGESGAAGPRLAAGAPGTLGTGVAVTPGLVERLRRLERPASVPARLNPGPAGVAAIAEAVGEALGVAPADALGAGRSRPVVQARAMVAHLARELTAMSYPEIARAMGRPSHSSVISADKRIRAQAAEDASIPLVGGADPRPVRELLAELRGRLSA